MPAPSRYWPRRPLRRLAGALPTDYVFDGAGSAPFAEDAPTGPLSVYGQTKLEGEQAIRASGCRHLIFRTSCLRRARRNFAKTMLRLAGQRDELKVVADQFGAPTSAELIADVTAQALQRLRWDAELAARASGTYHLVASGETSWHPMRASSSNRRWSGLGVAGDAAAGPADHHRGLPGAGEAPGQFAPRQPQAATGLGLVLPDWRHHAGRMIQELSEQGPL